MYRSMINIDDYDYDLPEDRIAQYPVSDRDFSKLLVLKGGVISKDIFRNIGDHIPAGSLLVFNNSKVIRARLLFGKDTGAVIEVLCLEPIDPAEYENSFRSNRPVEWKCIVGNLKKWKRGRIKLPFNYRNTACILEAEKVKPEGETWRIRFSWDSDSVRFDEVIEAAGHVPLPPYINRNDENADAVSYQTIYSSIRGSVAAPTAGLHFTDNVFEMFRNKGISTAEITLHVGAGTFQPVKTQNALHHEMHNEHIFISQETIKTLIEYHGMIIPVGTTSVRTLESIYWLGVKLAENPDVQRWQDLSLGQWDAYKTETEVPVNEALNAILHLMEANNLLSLHLTTSLMIIPGYRFRMINGIITNFHQPKSTLLLLISAWTGEKWKDIYRFAMENDFRFLSYGDSSLLLHQ